MKIFFVFMGLMALSLVVVACGTSKNDTNNTSKEPIVEDNTNGKTIAEDDSTKVSPDQGENAGSQQDMQSKMDEFDYTEFNLDVDYANRNDYEVELEKNSDNSIEAELDDSINGVKKIGAEAFNELYPLVKQLAIVQETSKEDAINEVLKTFNIEKKYSKLELEITFKDGTKIEYEDRK